MKVRTGFVSNSSSSSFAIIGIKTKLKDIDPETFKKKIQYLARPIEGFEGGEGETYFYISDKKSLDFLLKYSDIISPDAYQILAETSDGTSDISTASFPKNKNISLLCGTMDQSSPTDFDGIKDMFEYEGLLKSDDDDGNVDSVNYIRLTCTTGNSNKFYEMTKVPSDGIFKVRYGRIGHTGKEEEYDISLWDSKLAEKINKGYKIV